MELTQIRYFLEVAETQHITRSAEKLHIAQPSLTQAIHRFEESVGVPLFVSKGRNIVLTEYGKYLQKKLKPIVDELDMIPEQVQTMAKLTNDTIHLNVLSASAIITDAIIDFKNSKENISFQLLQDAQDGLYDIEITTQSFDEHKKLNAIDGRSNVFVCEEQIYLAVPNVERFMNIESIRMADVMDEGFISLAGSRYFKAICDKYCRQIGFKPKVIFESDNLAAVKNMITANMGVGFWPEFTWGNIDKKHVKLLKIDDMDFKRTIIISYNLNKLDNSNVIEFFEYLKEYCINRKLGR